MFLFQLNRYIIEVKKGDMKHVPGQIFTEDIPCLTVNVNIE